MNKYYYVGIDCLPTRLNEKGYFYVIQVHDQYDQVMNISYEDLDEAKKFIKLLDKNHYTKLKIEVNEDE